MGKSLAYEQQLLSLVFQALPTAALFQNGTAPVTSLWVALHTADPGANQGGSEPTYTGYGRVSVPRSTAGWSISGNSVFPVSLISFPIATAGSSTITNWSVGTAQTGTTELLYSGTVSPTISVVSGTTPILTTATSVSES